MIVSSEFPKSDLWAVGDGLPPRVIVAESRGRWAAALRQEMASQATTVFEAGAVAGAWDELERRPASFVVAELTKHDLRELLDRVAAHGRRFPRSQVAVVADRPLADWEWLFREAGAVHFTISPRQIGRLAGIARRHLAMAPPPARSAEEQIWARLPWGAT